MAVRTLGSGLGRIFLAGLLALFAACGGGSEVSVVITTGSLLVSVSGLPAGVDGNVAISGPGGFTLTIPATQTSTSLTPGTYTVTASEVLSGSAAYTPQPATQTVAVSAGATANASVSFASATTLGLALEEVVSGLSAPLFLAAPTGDTRLFIVERAGRIRIVQRGALLATPFLDISPRVSTAGERGLLSMTFDPQYASNGFFFVFFTDPDGDIAIERFQVSSGNPDLADPASSLRILTIGHRDFANHNGGLVAFGPDGFLYIGTGDGGGGGDPLGNGQNLGSLLGKLLRIDVRNASVAQPYAIPPLNPFVGQSGRRGEIWAYGLRNPWRYAFDAVTGSVYIADVGQNTREEVNVASAAAPGLNYGWNITEGSLCFASNGCTTQGLSLPVLEYAHDANGGCSITGGYVYRGSALPELRGRYFYSDFCNGWLRSFLHGGGTAGERVDWNVANVGQIFSFGEDGQKELYMLSSTGSVFKIVRR